MDQQDALGVEQITKLKKYPSNSIIDLENYLIKTYQKYIILQREERRFIDVLFFLFTKNSIDIGLAVSCLSSPQKSIDI